MIKSGSLRFAKSDIERIFINNSLPLHLPNSIFHLFNRHLAKLFTTDVDHCFSFYKAVFKDGKIKKDYPIEDQRDAREELRNLPPIESDDEENE